MRVALFIASILTVLYVIMADTFYVKSDGSSSSSCGSSPSHPCRHTNLDPIVDKLGPGDVVNFLGGFYSNVEFTSIRKGSQDAPVRIIGSSTTTIRQIRIDNSDNLRLESLRIDGSDESNHGIKIIQSRYISVVNSQIKNTGKTGIFLQESPYLLVNNTVISDTEEQCIKGLRYDETESQYRGDEDAYSAGVVISYSTLTNCGTDGIYISTQDVQIRRNRISNTGFVKVYPPVHGIYCKSDNSLIEHNVIDTTTHNGITVRNTAVVRNNTVWNCGLKRLSNQAHLAGSCYTFYNDGPHDGGIVAFENNLCYQAGPYATTGINVIGGIYQARGYTFNILNNTVYFVSDAITIEDASESTAYIYNNKLVLSNSGEVIQKSNAGKIVDQNNFKEENAGRANQIFVRPGTGDYRDYRLLDNIDYSEKPLSVYPRAAWRTGRHSAVFSTNAYPTA